MHTEKYKNHKAQEAEKGVEIYLKTIFKYLSIF